MPLCCPECSQEVTRFDDEVAHRCINPACPAQRIGRLLHFASRDALNIKAIGSKVAEAFINQRLIGSPLDLFEVGLNKLSSFDLNQEQSGTGTRLLGKNAEKIIQALEESREIPLSRWLFATGIPNVGKTAAEHVAAAHKNIRELARSQIIESIIRLNACYEQAAEINPRSTSNPPRDEIDREERQNRYFRLCGEIGVLGDTLTEAGVAAKKAGTALPPQYITTIKTEVAKAIKRFFDSDYGKMYLEKLDELGINPTSAKPLISGHTPLAGVGIVLTGTLSRSRSEYADQIKAAGGVIQESVTKNTNYLVAGENTGATKITKAKKLGTTVIDEPGLIALLSGEVLQPRAEPVKAPTSAIKTKAAAVQPDAAIQQSLFDF
jgi:DNA ligase (NAD+)